MRDKLRFTWRSDVVVHHSRVSGSRTLTTMERKMHRMTIGAAILLAVLPFAALAQSAPPSSATPPEAASTQRSEARAKMRAACGADVQKFCANIERGKGAMRTCLESHQNDLSTACKAARAERAAARAKDRS